MSKGPGENDVKDKETTLAEKASLLTNVPGVGPRTAEKMVAAGYESIEKVASASAEELAEAVSGLSTSKAEVVISEAASLLEAIRSGAVNLSGKTKSKRKKAAEPEPERIELPLLEEPEAEEKVVSLATGFDREKEELGIPIGPKWLTKFERARVIGARALQIAMGAPTLIDMSTAPKGLFALAEAELKAGVLPMTVRRTLPTGEYADIPLSLLLKHTRLD
ncbi:MAG: DNA-directed RNA polymerase subunit K [Candidatus Thorarchaeota archaeon]|nr:MAG: DNA-directed RNA polymerase subunit K [Candidatus Thorarchaeota archaeon]